MLALSSLSKSTRYVAILYAGAIFFTEAMFGVLRVDHRTRRASPGFRSARNLENVTDVMFRQTPRYDTPVDRLRAGAAGPGRRVDLGARAPRARRRGGVVSAADSSRPSTLSKWYGQVIGLNDVTVSVPPGITGLLGPNGAGKSTFMKLITGQLRPSKGDVKVLGEPIWGNPKLYLPHRVLSRAGRVLRPDDRARMGDGARAPERLRRERRPRPRPSAR